MGMDAAERLRNLLSSRVVFLDGAMGTMLMKRGMPPGVNPERWAAENPVILKRIHRDYVLAGSDVVLTCTFGGTAFRLGEDPERLNTTLAEILLNALDEKAVPGASVGPTGLLMAPLGELTWIDAYKAFHKQATALARAGIEVFFLETFSDPRELKAAALAVRDVCPHGFVSAQMSFSEEGYSLAGTTPEALAILVEQIPVDAVGANCSVGPDSLAAPVKAMVGFAGKPVCVEPNAGMPDSDGRHTMNPADFASRCEDLAWEGASIIGGCCGTGPEHIKALTSMVGRRKTGHSPGKPPRALSSLTRVVHLGTEMKLVGESINPTGRKDLKDAIRDGDTGFVVSAAGRQPRADVLDINLGLERMIPDGFVSNLFAKLACGPPLSVDLSDPDNIELAFRELGGIGLLNSLTCDPKFIGDRIETLKRHGGYAVLLPLDSDGLPENPDDRVRLVRRGLAALREFGFPPRRAIVDPVVKALASGADPNTTVKTLKRMKKAGWLTIAGVSNISHGLPERRAANLAFLVKLAEAGLDLAIVDVTRRETLSAARGAQILSGRIPASGGIDFEEETSRTGNPLEEAILRGDPRDTLIQAGILLEQGTPPADLVERHLQKAMGRLGSLFEKKKAFLPHLIAGAEAAHVLTGLLKPLLETGSVRSRGTVVLATVRGDLHDIGKNLVALFLEGAGFRVVDLGRDVPSDRIVDAASLESPVAVALSALMSSTAVRMEEVVIQLREKGLATPVLIGGAVITPEYAERIGAHYAREAFAAVEIIEGIMRENGA
jgi:5-methyltetrahydrofolate--homocysteine methyltransferase